MTETPRVAGTNRRSFLRMAGLSAGALTIPGVVAASTRESAAAVATPYYLNCYFPNTSEHRMHYSLSTDGYRFTAYGANPVLIDTVGTGDKLLRDPMIIREVNNPGRYHLVATYSWADRPFVVWDSTNLTTWTNGRLVYPSDASMKQTWAPEFGYDAASGRYFVYWTGCINNDWNTACIRYMTTTDFVNWSAPRTLFSKSVPIMDASIFVAGGKFHMVYRQAASIYQVTSSRTILGPYNQNDHLAVNANYEGPFVYQLSGQNVWLMIMDIYGNKGPYAMARSTDAVTWTQLRADQFSFPSGAADRVRHGSVMAITADEYTRLSGTTNGSVRRLRSYRYSDRYVRHYALRAQLDPNVSPLADSQFQLVPGLAGGGTVSFQSVNYPGYYLRHRNFEVWLDPADRTSQFNADASFYQRSGLADGAGVSFEAANYAGRYIQQSAYLLYVQVPGTAADRGDATFYLA